MGKEGKYRIVVVFSRSSQIMPSWVRAPCKDLLLLGGGSITGGTISEHG